MPDTVVLVHGFWVTPRSWEDWITHDEGNGFRIMPPAVQRSNAGHYTSNTVTEHVEYDGFAHLLPAQNGREEVADHALDRVLRHAR